MVQPVDRTPSPMQLQKCAQQAGLPKQTFFKGETAKSPGQAKPGKF